MVLKDKVLFLRQAGRIVVLKITNHLLMNKFFLFLCLYAVVSVAQADTVGCNCANKASTCPRNDLTRDDKTQPLSEKRTLDTLSIGKPNAELSRKQVLDNLSQSVESETLSKSGKQDTLTRGKETAPLSAKRTRDDLARDYRTDDLILSKKDDRLTRSQPSEDLLTARTRDDLSRGKQDEPLSRCN